MSAEQLDLFDPTERWLPVIGYQGAYEVSDQGRVRSLDRRIPYSDGRKPRLQRGRILRPGDTGTGLLVHLGRGMQNQKAVHRLVLEAFVGPCPPGMEGCHWNDNHHDNRLENLRWDTHGANELDKARNLRARKAEKQSPLSDAAQPRLNARGAAS